MREKREKVIVECFIFLSFPGAYGLVEEFEWSVSLISIETDLFSLELPATMTTGSGTVVKLFNDILKIGFFLSSCSPILPMPNLLLIMLCSP